MTNTITVKANLEFSGMSDYWSGNGRRWDDDASCLFASFDQTTTWLNLIAQFTDWQPDMDDKPLWKDVTFAALDEAIKLCLRGYGYADYKQNDICLWSAELPEGEEYQDECPQLILLVELA